MLADSRRGLPKKELQESRRESAVKSDISYSSSITSKFTPPCGKVSKATVRNLQPWANAYFMELTSVYPHKKAKRRTSGNRFVDHGSCVSICAILGQPLWSGAAKSPNTLRMTVFFCTIDSTLLSGGNFYLFTTQLYTRKKRMSRLCPWEIRKPVA